MVAMDLGFVLDLGIPLDRIVIGMVITVLALTVYQAVVLITAILATRSDSGSSIGRTMSVPGRGDTLP